MTNGDGLGGPVPGDVDPAARLVAEGEALEASGKLTEAEATYRSAAEMNYGPANRAIGRLLRDRGDAIGAVAAFRSATLNGDAAAALELAEVHRQRNELVESREWLQWAADAGVEGAAEQLGKVEVLWAERLSASGDVDAGVEALRRAVRAGDEDARRKLGRIYTERAAKLDASGDRAEAEVAYREAAEFDHAPAMGPLGRLLAERGERAEAESVLRRGQELGDSQAVRQLAELLQDRGDDVGAEQVLAPLAGRGDVAAARAMGVLLAARGANVEAERFFTIAAKGGDAVGAFRLAVLLEGRGRTDAARKWYRVAADLGHPEAEVAFSRLGSGGRSGWGRWVAAAGLVAVAAVGVLWLVTRSDPADVVPSTTGVAPSTTGGSDGATSPTTPLIPEPQLPAVTQNQLIAALPNVPEFGRALGLDDMEEGIESINDRYNAPLTGFQYSTPDVCGQTLTSSGEVVASGFAHGRSSTEQFLIGGGNVELVGFNSPAEAQRVFEESVRANSACDGRRVVRGATPQVDESYQVSWIDYDQGSSMVWMRNGPIVAVASAKLTSDQTTVDVAARSLAEGVAARLPT